MTDLVPARGFSANEIVRKKLFDSAMQGNWAKAKKLYQKNPWLRSEKITVEGDTALHLAVRDRNDKVVEEMVELVSPEQYVAVLKSQNEQGNTPLHLSAYIGNDSMCKCFLSKYKDLLSVLNNEGENPLFLAARFGQIKAFLCLASKSDLLRNKKGETILHSAMAGGHFELAYLIIERYKNLSGTYDEKGVSPLHLLAKQPTAFRSGTRLSMMNKIIYHCTVVTPLCLEKYDVPAKRQTLSKLLQVPWNNINIKRLFSSVVKFIKICINPSSGSKAEKARSDTDEENRLTLDQGPDQRNNENGKRVGLSGRNFPMNYDTCFNFIMLLINAFLIIFLGIGRSYLDKIRKKKENHVLSVKILKRILEKDGGRLYDSTGANPLYKDRTISYKGDKVDKGNFSGEKPELDPELEKSSKEGEGNFSGEKPELHTELEKSYKEGEGNFSGEKPKLDSELEKISKEGEGNFSGEKPELDPELEKSSKEGEVNLSGEKHELHPELEKSSKEGEGNFSGEKPELLPELRKSSKEGEGNFSGEKPELYPELEKSSKEVHKVEEVQRAPDLLMHKVLEEVQRSTDSIHKLLEQAQTYGLPVVNADKSQKLNKSLKEDPNWGLMETMSKAINQTAKKLDEELFPEKREEEKLETPMLIAAKNGIVEMVESILACFPEAILDANTEKKNVVLLAVEKGHPHVYNVLLKKATNLTDIVFGAVDDRGNSALHLAAMFTDPRPWLTPGAALQMQWEIRWFEYVKNSKPSNFFPAVNQKGESPQQIFTDKHKDLVKNGGEWLNNTATSCSVVSTLIATVAFATSSSLPGGNRENTGMPILELKPAFHLFTISSLIALCFSITATIMFLAILTSRLREKDFAKDLPVKLLAGLTSLFVSILAILVSFCSAHFFVLQKELRDYALLIYAATCLLATLFAIAQLPLYIDLTWTTFSTVPQPPLEEDT